MPKYAALHELRYAYKPKLPWVLQGSLKKITARPLCSSESVADQEEIKALFPLTYGQPILEFQEQARASAYAEKSLHAAVVLSGGQAPGGHNVIAGLFDGLKKGNPNNRLWGFIGGAAGLTRGEFVEITQEAVDGYRNTGGFDLIQSGRDKIESKEQFEKALASCQALKLNALIIVGGDDSNTNAAVLAEYFLAQKAGIQVIGVPKTIDGDLKNEHIEVSFGFDSACKTYAELIGNIQRDANSARKYWHFVKLMGRSASHIALECAMRTHPNICLISEEIAAKKMTLKQVVEVIAASVRLRAQRNAYFGVVLVPEGLIEFIPELKTLVEELNLLLSRPDTPMNSKLSRQEQKELLKRLLSQESAAVYFSLPAGIQSQLLMDRDPHGNVQVSAIDTEKMLIGLTGKRMEELRAEGKFNGKFSGISHFFGYEGRCAFPSNFDSDYCYTLGYTAYLAAAHGCTGYICCVKHLEKPSAMWVPGAVPLTMMMNMELRNGQRKPVIRKALVNLKGKPFIVYEGIRDLWALETCYAYPGPIQYFGPAEVCDLPPRTLQLEKEALD